MYRFCLTIVLVISYQLCLGQSFIRLNLRTYLICKESVFTCTYEASENFNSLKLQLRYPGTSELIDVPFQKEGSSIRFTIPSTLNPTNNWYCYLRLVNTNPYVEGDWSSHFDIGRLPDVKLASLNPSIGNRYSPAQVNFTGIGTFPIQITLSDSSKFSLDYGNDQDFNKSFSFIPKTEGAYRIASVSNNCGVGTSSGEASYKYNSISIKTAQVSPARVCVGMPIYVNYSVLEGNFNSNNQFKIRLVPYTYDFKPIADQSSVELNAILENDQLKAIIPADFFLGANGSRPSNIYGIQIISSSPSSQSDINGKVVYLYPATTVKLQTEAQPYSPYTLANREVNVLLTGLAPFKVSFTDGTSYMSMVSYDYGNYPLNNGTITKKVTPVATSVYTINEIQSGCGTLKGSLGEITVPVLPSIALGEYDKKGWSFCEGETARVKLVSTGTLSSNTQYYINLLYGMNQVVKTIPAKLGSDGYLSFVIPSIDDIDILNNFQGYNLQVGSQNPTFLNDKSWKYIQIFKKPNPRFYPVEPVDKGPVTLSIPWDGGSDMTYTYADGYVTTSNYREVYPTETTTYTIVSAQNMCGKSENLNTSITVELKNPLDSYLYLEEQSNNNCVPSEADLHFKAKGPFLAGNEFILQKKQYDTWRNTSYRASSDAKPIKLKGDLSGEYRLVSTNPVLISNPINLQFKVVPKVTIYKPEPLSHYGTYRYSVDNTYWIPGEDLTLGVNFEQYDADTEALLTDGIETYRFTPAQDRIVIPAPPRDQIYRISSVRNSCGVTQVNDAFHYHVLPFRIYTASENRGAISGIDYQHEACANTNFALQFTTEGTTGASTKYILQIASIKDSVFTNLATSAASPINARIPANLKTGLYLIRILAESPASRSATMVLFVKEAPTATLINPAQPIITYAGGSVYLPIQLTGSGPWHVVYNDLSDQIFHYSPNSKEFTVDQGKTYSLKTVSNNCGYGSTSGSIKVQVQQSLSLYMQSHDYHRCNGQTFNVQYSINGDFADQEQIEFTLYSTEGKKIKTLHSFPYRGSVQDQLQSLTLPNDLSKGTYYVQIKGNLSELSSQAYFYVDSKPEINISGGARINPGGEAYVRITNTKPYEYTSYIEKLTLQLSDGTIFKELTISPGSWQDIKVKPTQTTTYTVSKVENSCLTGTTNGSALITVNPLSDKQTSITQLQGLRSYIICQGDTIQVFFETKGSFSATNQFKVELYNQSTQSYQPLVTMGNTSPLKAVLPRDLSVSAQFYIRVMGTDANIQAATNNRAFTLNRPATAAFEQETVWFESGKAVKLNLKLTGDAPWWLDIRDSTYPYYGSNIRIDSLPAFLTVQPNSAQATYTINSVRNGCGVGTVLKPNQVKLEFITATLPEQKSVFKVYPNPSSNWIRIELPGSSAFQIHLFSTTGQLLDVQSIQGSAFNYSLKNLPSGTYILQSTHGKRVDQVRIIKN